VTGLATGEPDRSLTPTRTSTARIGASGPIPTIVVLLVLGFALRAIIAYALPGSGFANDLAAFRFWADALARNGLANFYSQAGFHDYTPGYMLYLWVVGLIHQVLPTLELIKVPAILSDLAIGWLIWSMIRDLGGSERMALAGAALYLFIPISWFDSVVWGQVDSVGVVFMLLGVRALWQDRPEMAALWAVVAPVVKPQLGILAFVTAAVLVRRHLWDPIGRGSAPTGDPDDPISDAGETGGAARSPGFIERAVGRGPIRLVTSGAVALVTVSALTLPFRMWIPGLIGQVQTAFGGYPYITVNAYNPWALVEQAGLGLARNGQWLCDAVTANPDICAPGSQVQIGPLPAVAVGTILLFAAILGVMAVVFRRPDRITILIGVSLLAVAFFVLPTRVHERYMFPFFALAAILAVISFRWRWAYAILALASFLNMYVVLTTLYPGNPQISDWLGMGSFIRSQPGVTFVAILNTLGFALVVVQLWPAGTRVVRRELSMAVAAEKKAEGPRTVGAVGGAGTTGSRSPAGLAAAGAGGRVAGAWIAGGSGASAVGDPDRDWPDADPDRELAWLGWLGPIRRALAARPLRADRSRALHDEPTGRLDRLDVWLVLVLVISAFGLRMWRLDEPASMHFDEVYHARTATEFLQDWRYGIPHSIYEYTHPHLAKYAMALGIIAWGDDRVTSTSDLGVSVRDAIVEERWDDPTMPDHRAGDRLYVVTGSEVRVYDLVTRALLVSLPVDGASSLAIDPSTHRLFIGTDGGAVDVLDTAEEFDALRIGGDASQVAPPVPFGDAGGPVKRLLATGDGTYVVAITTADNVVSLDGASGETLGRTKLTKPADLAEAGTAQALVAHPSAVTSAADEAATLAELLGGDAESYRARLGASGTQVVVAGSVDADVKKSIDAAITEGQLEGLAFADLPQIGVADARGVTLVDPATMATTDEVPIAGGATGLAASSNLDAPRLYAAGGSSVVVIKLAQNAQETTPPAVETTVKMPGRVSKVTFDPASVMIHVLGQTPDGSASTIYALEPHALPPSVYADARLPFAPVAWATDVAADFPSADRQQIMALSDDGSVAAVDIGDHEFSWRVPGVIAGALTAGLLYLLARLLFRRRSIGVLAAIFTLADGMMFVQSRIAMNDVYVGLFLMAAYLLFAVIWLGIWRWRGAFWVAMPVIGVLLGLALASKWVAAYAMAAMVLLILIRSALGRVVTILGLILATAVLGYQGIVVSADATSSSGNVLFLLLMIGLTLIATVVTVTHPIRWSPEEVRIAVGAPAGLGIALGLVAIPLAGSSAKVSVGPITGLPQVLLTAGLLLLFIAGGIAALFALAGRWGIGPLAPPTGDSAVAPASPPPTGWLRPGWAFGIPIGWAAICLILVPIVVYVISYIPWALNSGGPAGSPQIFPAGTPIIGNWPPGHNGQTLLGLTGDMYRYHNDLRATHAAASPWWAWPFDLKPVWFYQGSFAGDTSAAIYDAGNLVIWWLGVPAMAFIVWQAYKRRSLALALITIAFAFQWLSWSRIDRATFQYHYYTSVPFIILALAYLMAELWHGASFRTWVLARVAAALAIMGPGLLWLLKTPLCGFVGVDRAYANSPACHGNPGDFVLTVRSAGLVLVVGIGIVVLIYQLTHLEDRRPGGRPPSGQGWLNSGMTRLLMSAAIAIAAVVLVSAVAGDQVLISVQSFSILPLAAIVVGFLGFVGWFVLSARDARRFVAGAVFAAIGEFLVLYPNIAALPLPSTVFNAYQGLLPTYLYPFQFPVNTDAPANVPGIFQPDRNMFGLPGVPVLAVFLTITCLIVAYAAWSWRQASIDREWLAEEGSQPSTG
jgi:Gpi18-like mannosyltransferase